MGVAACFVYVYRDGFWWHNLLENPYEEPYSLKMFIPNRKPFCSEPSDYMSNSTDPNVRGVRFRGKSEAYSLVIGGYSSCAPMYCHPQPRNLPYGYGVWVFWGSAEQPIRTSRKNPHPKLRAYDFGTLHLGPL